MDRDTTQLIWREHTYGAKYDGDKWYIVRTDSQFLGVRYAIALWTKERGFLNRDGFIRNVTHVAEFDMPFDKDK